LVAEDNPINQKVIVSLLAGCGIELVLANDGQEALEILERDSNFLLILMDAHMPRVDGFEATRRIRENPRYDHILVVALSGDVGADDIQKMKSAGMSEQLEKPLRLESLYKIFYAYSKKEPQSDAAPKSILDVQHGLETCGGDERFYREILSEFIDDYGDSAQRLGELLRAHDIEAADALLLDIVGVTANIGAHPLEESASSLKLALKDTNERSYFSLFDRYKIQLERVVQEIRGHLG
jgi:CheY-like chemotaxis protein